MPFTPFHFGPGLLLKTSVPQRFSFVAFVVSQVLIDIETGVNLVRDYRPVHGVLHTYLGSLLIVPITCFVLFGWHSLLKRQRIRVSLMVFSSLIGVWSHVSLDSLMHRDITPWIPFTSSNPMLGKISYAALHLGCFAAGVIGILIWQARIGFRRLSQKARDRRAAPG
jgi:membrane-bound metal-dependent hydrolase YbcI (DUF457 family)